MFIFFNFVSLVLYVKSKLKKVNIVFLLLCFREDVLDNTSSTSQSIVTEYQNIPSTSQMEIQSTKAKRYVYYTYYLIFVMFCLACKS